jgi:hypothetical protein
MVKKYCRKASLARGEARRLAMAQHDADWKLASGTLETRRSSCPRGGGKETPCDSSLLSEEDDPETPQLQAPVAVAVEEEENEEPLEATMEKFKKPAHNRVVVEVEHIDKAIASLACRDCGEAVKVSIKTVCLASSIGFECTNEDCGFIYHPEAPAGTTIHLARGDNFERSTDYAINVLYVIGFMSMGDGPTEAARQLGLLGLPNDTTMKSRSFNIIEGRIGPIIRDLVEETILENLKEEARLSMEADPVQDEYDYKVWKDSLTDKSIKLSVAKMPKLHGSYDMAWQQKGSGHQYNSVSGHGTIVGRRTRKVIALVIKCKVCCACTAWEKKHPGLEILPHTCYKNHEGSSGSMESAGIVELLVSCFDKYQAVVAMLCCDDDSSIRADCQWSNADYLKNNNTDILPMVPKKVGVNKGKLHPRPDKGKLPGHVPEPKFVADPNHRRKTLTGELIKLDTASIKVKHTMTRMDSMRLGKNFGYMARALRDKPRTEFITAAEAVLEHHFDVHDHCGDWCPRGSETLQVKG